MPPQTGSKRRRVLVTGGGGFIGTALVNRLEAGGLPVEVAAPSRAELDLARADQVDRWFRRYRPDTVVHLAASLAREDSPADTERQWRDTFTTGRLVLDAAAAAGVRHVLAAGSVEELGGQRGVLTTDLPARPLSVYGLCKSLLLEAARSHVRRQPRRIDWFRPFTVYGPQVGTGLVAYAFERAMRGEEARFSDGRQQRDFVHVDDIAAWLHAGIGWAGPLEPGLVLHHLGTGTGTTVAGVLDLIHRECGAARFILGARRRQAGEPDCQVAPGPGHQTAPWPWRPEVPVADGIRRTAEWWKAARTSDDAVDRPAGV